MVSVEKAIHCALETMNQAMVNPARPFYTKDLASDTQTVCPRTRWFFVISVMCPKNVLTILLRYN